MVIEAIHCRYQPVAEAAELWEITWGHGKHGYFMRLHNVTREYKEKIYITEIMYHNFAERGCLHDLPNYLKIAYKEHSSKTRTTSKRTGVRK